MRGDDFGSQAEDGTGGGAGGSLHAPRGGLPAQLEPSKRKHFTPRNVAVQCVGAVASLGLIAWVVVTAVNDTDAAAWERLRSASVVLIALLVLSAGASIASNGLIFWAVIRPARRIDAVYLVALNGVATLLASLPFKISVLVRGLIHHRRDRLPFRLILAWLAAVGGLGLATLVPLAAIGLWRGRTDAVWLVSSIASVIAVHVVIVWASRVAEGGFARGWLARVSLGATALSSDWRSAAGHAVFRLLDVAALSVRFAIAAAILGVELDAAQAVLLGTTFFLLSVTAPSGNIGLREAGTVVVAGIAGVNAEALALLVLMASLAELLAAALMAVPGAAIIAFTKRGVTGGVAGGVTGGVTEGAAGNAASVQSVDKGAR